MNRDSLFFDIHAEKDTIITSEMDTLFEQKGFIKGTLEDLPCWSITYKTKNNRSLYKVSISYTEVYIYKGTVSGKSEATWTFEVKQEHLDCGEAFIDLLDEAYKNIKLY